MFCFEYRHLADAFASLPVISLASAGVYCLLFRNVVSSVSLATLRGFIRGVNSVLDDYSWSCTFHFSLQQLRLVVECLMSYP